MPVNVALFGSGIFASTAYLPALAASKSDVTLHSVWSRSTSSVRSLCDAANKLSLSPSNVHNGPEGLEAVLNDKDVDAVMVVLPITAQPEIIRKAWAKGKHVLSEKPLHKDVKSAKELVDEYEREWKPKGLLWRVAENFAHEPILQTAGEILSSTPDLGPVLYWSLNSEATVHDGSKYQATTWRTIPDYQGGFLLDGGVHWTALLRTVLPPSARPSSILSTSSLHRTHLPPHDTILGISLPSSQAITEPHGPKTKLTSAAYTESDIPSRIGKSGPSGQITLSFAVPDVDASAKRANGLHVVLLHGILDIFVPAAGTREWRLTLTPTKDSNVKPVEKTADPEGVEQEVAQFGRAVQAAKEGKEAPEKNNGEPRDALWDLAVLEALLQSEGKPVELDQLLA